MLGASFGLLQSLVCHPSQAAERSGVVIERIEITGVTVFGSQAIQSAIEVNPGDVLDRGRVVRSSVALQTLYRVHGYEQVSIRTQLSRHQASGAAPEDVLEFIVNEGLPTRINDISVYPEGNMSPSTRKQWLDLFSSLRTRIEFAKGDLLDQEKLGAARRAVQDYLASREFVGARVEDIKLEPSSVPAGFEKVPAGKWVNLVFRVRPGDRVTFGFRGNNVFNLTKLLALVEDQRVLGFGKDYLTAIRARVEEEYRALGYNAVRIEVLTFEDPVEGERHITYEIKEGPRYRMESVDFDGNEAFTNQQLRDEFYARASGLIQQGYYYEKDVQKAAELVIEWMKSKGYLSAKLVTINTILVPRKRVTDPGPSIRITIYIYEWDQTIVQSLSIQGAKAIPISEIQATLGVKEGAPLNLFTFIEGVEALKALYRSRGYLGMKLVNEGTDQVVLYSRENRYADVVLELDEGPLFRTSRILIEGAVKTQDYVIRREFLFKEGQILEEKQITDTEARLRRLGLFSVVSVRVSDDPEKEGFKIIRISVQEGTPGVYGGGVGFRNDLGPRAFGGVAYSNLWGKNHTVSVDASTNRRIDETYRFAEYQAQLVYVWPWFVLNDTTFRPAFTVSGREYSAFDAFTISAAATFEKRLLPPLTGVVSYSLERVRQANSAVDLDNQILTIGAITTSARADFRDNPLAPTRGLYTTASFEVAAPFLLSQGEDFPVGYTRFLFRGDYLIPISSSISWYLSFRTGLSRSTQAPVIDPKTGSENPKSGSIPLIKQFALGGAGSVRGFKEQELNDYAFAIRGTQSYVNYRTQLDLPFSGALRFGPFLDAANLQLDAWTLGNLRYGAGFGFHYQTPVGPVNLDYGVKLDPRPGEDTSAVYFSIGVI